MTIAKLWCGSEDSFRQTMELQEKVSQAILNAAVNPDSKGAKHSFAKTLKALAVGSSCQTLAFMGDDEDFEEERESSPYAARIGDYLITRGDSGLASVSIAGGMVRKYDWWHQYLPGLITSYDAIRDAMDIIAEDSSIQRVILSFDTGGGQATGVQEAADAIYKTAQSKPMVAFTESASFSAGYWLMSSAPQIVAPKMAQVGSIGVIMIHTSIKEMGAKAGINWTVFRAGEYKALGTEYEDIDEKTKAHFLDSLEKTNSFFLAQVSERRGLSLKTSDSWAEGRTFFAQDAMDLGLLDQIMTADQLLSAQSAALNHSQLRGSLAMKISQDKLNRIEAGEAPSEVLTEEELNFYNAAVTEGNDPAAATTEPAKEPSAADDDKGDTEPAGPAPAAGTDMTQISRAEYNQLIADKARLELKLETRDEQLANLQAELTQSRENLQAMVPAAQHAVKGLHNLLSISEAVAGEPAALMAQFNAATERKQQVFPVGQQSAAAAHKEGSPQTVPSATQRRIQAGGKKS